MKVAGAATKEITPRVSLSPEDVAAAAAGKKKKGNVGFKDKDDIMDVEKVPLPPSVKENAESTTAVDAHGDTVMGNNEEEENNNKKPAAKKTAEEVAKAKEAAKAKVLHQQTLLQSYAVQAAAMTAASTGATSGNGTATTTTAAQQAGYDNKRSNVKFYDIMFEVTNPSAKCDLVQPARKAFLGAMDALKGIDESLTLLVYKPTKDANPFQHAIPANKLTDADFPKNMNQMLKYMESLGTKQPKDTLTYKLYTSIKIGFNMDEANFFESASKRMQASNGTLYLATLQQADIKCDGYLAGVHRNANLVKITEYYQFQINMKCLQRGIEPIIIAAKKKFIWDGLKTGDRPSNWVGYYAPHIFFRADQIKIGRPIVKSVTALYNASGLQNYPIRYADVLNPKTQSPREMNKCHQNRGWHIRGTGSMLHHFTTDFMDPDLYTEEAPKLAHPTKEGTATFSIRRYLFSLEPKNICTNNQHVPLFLSCEPDYGHGGHWLTFSRRHALEAEAIAKGLPMYVMKHHGEGSAEAGDAILRLLSETGQELYLSLDWDEESQSVITIQEKDMEANITCFEADWSSWCDGPKAAEDDSKPAAVSTKRPLPKDGKEVFDDKSVMTTASQMTIRGELADLPVVPTPNQQHTDELQAKINQLEADAKILRDAVSTAERAQQTATELQAKAEQVTLDLAAAIAAQQELEKETTPPSDPNTKKHKGLNTQANNSTSNTVGGASQTSTNGWGSDNSFLLNEEDKRPLRSDVSTDSSGSIVHGANAASRSNSSQGGVDVGPHA